MKFRSFVAILPFLVKTILNAASKDEAQLIVECLTTITAFNNLHNGNATYPLLPIFHPLHNSDPFPTCFSQPNIAKYVTFASSPKLLPIFINSDRIPSYEYTRTSPIVLITLKATMLPPLDKDTQEHNLISFSPLMSDPSSS